MSEIAILDQLQNALARFDESLQTDAITNPLAIDATIQRFEFCFKLFWKFLQKLLYLREGIETRSPKRTLQEALILGWITDEAPWLQILSDRNLT